MEIRNQQVTDGHINRLPLFLLLGFACVILSLGAWAAYINSPEEKSSSHDLEEQNFSSHYGHSMIQRLENEAEREKQKTSVDFSQSNTKSMEEYLTKYEQGSFSHTGFPDMPDVVVRPDEEHRSEDSLPSASSSAALSTPSVSSISPTTEEVQDTHDVRVRMTPLQPYVPYTEGRQYDAAMTTKDARLSSINGTNEQPSPEDEFRLGVQRHRYVLLQQALAASTTSHVQHQYTNEPHGTDMSSQQSSSSLQQELAQARQDLATLNGRNDGVSSSDPYGNEHGAFTSPYIAQDKARRPQGGSSLHEQQTLAAYQELATSDFTLPSRVEDAASSSLRLLQGSVLPCVLLTGINSDIPGQVLAQVRSDVYDTVTGDHLLIPQGTRVLGQYISSPRYGERRLMLGFSRLIFPDGRSLALGSMPGSGPDGYAGFSADVNNHYAELFTHAVLLGGISAGVTLSVDDRRDDNGDLTLNGALSQGLGQSLGRVMTEVIERNMAVSPTLEVQPGFLFAVTLTKDICFATSYDRKEGLARQQ